MLDGEGRACSVTCTNGSGSGIVVPGTGIHLNNIMGEQDLNPLGFFQDPPGRRMPSMMAPTVVLDESGAVELVVGSAGSNRIRSAILQVVVNVVDHGMSAGERDRGAAAARRGRRRLRRARRRPVAIEAGGAQHRAASASRTSSSAACRPSSAARDGSLSGGGDPRRDGAAVAA